MFARDQHSQIQEDNGDAQTDAPTQEPVHTDEDRSAFLGIEPPDLEPMELYPDSLQLSLHHPQASAQDFELVESSSLDARDLDILKTLESFKSSLSERMKLTPRDNPSESNVTISSTPGSSGKRSQAEGSTTLRTSGACVRCRALKIRCEFLAEDERCRRCLEGDHECVIPGPMKRQWPQKREGPLAKIQEQGEVIIRRRRGAPDENRTVRLGAISPPLPSRSRSRSNSPGRGIYDHSNSSAGSGVNSLSSSRSNSFSQRSMGGPRAHSRSADDDGENFPGDNTNNAHSRKESTRRQRIEAEQRRRDELREAYAELKDVLPAKLSQKSTKIDLLKRATNRILDLQSRIAALEKELQIPRRLDDDIVHTNEMSSSELLLGTWDNLTLSFLTASRVAVAYSTPLHAALRKVANEVWSSDNRDSAIGDKIYLLAKSIRQLHPLVTSQVLYFLDVERFELIKGAFDDASRSLQNTYQYKGDNHQAQAESIEGMLKLDKFLKLLRTSTSSLETKGLLDDALNNARHKELLNRLGHIDNGSLKPRKYSHEGYTECAPGTRMNVLSELTEWAINREGTPFFLLSGSTGTGKSTVAQTFCKRLGAYGIEVASFFCSHTAGTERNDAQRIVPTLAYQIADRVQGFLMALCRVLELPDAVDQPIPEQFQRLLWDPLDETTYSMEAWEDASSLVVVIDGLDECSDTTATEAFIRSLILRADEGIASRLRFVIVNRLEPHISGIIDEAKRHFHVLDLDEVPTSRVNSDMREYLKVGLADVCKRTGWHSRWYTEDDVDVIASKANGLFIYTATALRYLEGSGYPPNERLQDILRTKTASVFDLYAQILGKLEPEPKDMILFVLAHLPTPFPLSDIAKILSLSVKAVLDCLKLLSCFVIVHEGEDLQPVYLLHASFKEFLLDHWQANSGFFHRDLLLRCLEILNQNLRKGILGDQVDRHTEKDDLASDISIMISPVLHYAATHWITHMFEWFSRSDYEPGALTTVTESLSNFVQNHVLHWVECLAWTGDMQLIVEELDKPGVLDALRNLKPEFGAVFDDVRHIIEHNFSVISTYPMEIYYSALLWLPKSAHEVLLREQKKHAFPVVLRGVPETWADMEAEGDSEGD